MKLANMRGEPSLLDIMVSKMKKNVSFDWDRFICPRDVTIQFSIKGYVSTEYFMNSDLHPVSYMDQFKCSVLLGEAGIGKTTIFNNLEKLNNADSTKYTLFEDLGTYDSSDSLRSLFKKEIFDTWRSSDKSLELYLDSYDECRIPKLANILIKEIKNLNNRDRLKIRVFSRSAAWPTILEKGLTEVFGETQVNIFKVTPLREKDIDIAAKKLNIDPDGFKTQIESLGVVPLAIKPITLLFLLNNYADSGALPEDQIQLYRAGCERLCEDPPERYEGQTHSRLDATSKMAIASIIAYLTVFTENFGVWNKASDGSIPQGFISKEDLFGSISCLGKQVIIDYDSLQVTLLTGLFVSHPTGGMVWAHHSYAEYLAAIFVKEHGPALEQTRQLLLNPNDSSVIPQLAGVTAWLALLDPPTFELVLQANPDFLLTNAISTADMDKRQQIVESLLQYYDKELGLPEWFSPLSNYTRLKNPDLSIQLSIYIEDKSKSFLARRTAIDIAIANELRDLSSVFLKVALNDEDIESLRLNCADAIVSFCDEETRLKLLPLAKGEHGAKFNDELKYYGLKAVWPALITIEELFGLLTYPSNPNLLGQYFDFLTRHLPESLKLNEDIVFGLKWIIQHKHESSYSDPFSQLSDEILIRALAFLDDTTVRNEIAQALIARQKGTSSIVEPRSAQRFQEALYSNNKGRRALIFDLVSLVTPDDIHILFPYQTSLVNKEDVPWLIELLLIKHSESVNRVISKIVARFFDPQDQELWEQIYSAGLQCDELKEECAFLFKPVLLNSPTAGEMRKSHALRQSFEDRHEEQNYSDDQKMVAIREYLKECHLGRMHIYPLLLKALTFENKSWDAQTQLLSNSISNFPGWTNLDDDEKIRFLTCVKKYVIDWPIDDLWFIQSDGFPYSIVAGIKSLEILLCLDPQYLVDNSESIFSKWASSIFAYPYSAHFLSEKAYEDLLKTSYDLAPERIIESLERIIIKENDNGKTITLARKLELIWDSQITECLFNIIQTSSLLDSNFNVLLKSLFSHNHINTINYANQFTHVDLDTLSAEQKERFAVAASLLLVYFPSVSWDHIFPALDSNEEIGLKTIIHIEKLHLEDPSILRSLSESQLKDLYTWLLERFPYDSDTHIEEGHFLDNKEMLEHFRNTLLEQLKYRGTNEACFEIRQLVEKYPQYEFLKYTLLAAEKTTRSLTYMWPTVEQLLKMIKDANSRFVRNGEDLLDIIAESLSRLEREFHDVTPSVRDVWDKIESDSYKPVDESDLSDRIKRHLSNDLIDGGIVLGREVEIRPSVGSGTGQKVDIHIDAIGQKKQNQSIDIISAIVEVKGCWHDELFSAMESQLVNKYLKESSCAFGLYLVGWFNCPQWDKAQDLNRYTAAFKIHDIQELKDKLNEQATALSNEDQKIRAFVLDARLHKSD